MIKSCVETGLMGEGEDDLTFAVCSRAAFPFKDEIPVQGTIVSSTEHSITALYSLPGKGTHLGFRPCKEVNAVNGKAVSHGGTEKARLPRSVTRHPVFSCLCIIRQMVMEDYFLLCAVAVDGLGVLQPEASA